MTYASERVLVGREPLTVVDLILDSCSLTYGTLPCTASGASGTECYNTRTTCQDTANYAKTTTTFRFCETRYTPPVGEQMYPALKSWKLTPSKITPGKGLGYRASVTITLQDFPHHDRGVDPYVSTRSAASGTFFGRLFARNKHYQNRLLKIRQGYVSSSGFDLANDFQDYVYVIDKVEGPDARGIVRITAKDMLKLMDDKRAQVPAATQGKLRGGISSTATQLTLDDGSEYAASGYCRIGSEIMAYTRTNAVMQITRAQWGTSASSHADGDTVQECVAYDGTNVVDVAYDLIANYTEVDEATYITPADWDTERDQWLVGRTVNAILSAPIGVNKLLGELTEQFGVDIWWDEVAQKIKLAALAPPRTSRTSLAAAELLEDSVESKQVTDDRLSQIWIYFDRLNHAEDGKKPENHAQVYVQSDLEQEGTDLYGEPRVKKVYSRWMASRAVAASSAGRTLRRYVDNPVELSFQVDAGGTLPEIADEISVTSRAVQDTDGSNKAHLCQVQSREEVEPGSKWEYTTLNSAYLYDRYAFIAPSSEFTADAGTDVLTSTAHGQSDDYAVVLETSDTLPAPLATATVYYVINSTADTMQLSATSGGAAINLTDAGTGTHRIKTPDYTDATATQQAKFAWAATTGTQKMSNSDDPYRII